MGRHANLNKSPAQVVKSIKQDISKNVRVSQERRDYLARYEAWKAAGKPGDFSEYRQTGRLVVEAKETISERPSQQGLPPASGHSSPSQQPVTPQSGPPPMTVPVGAWNQTQRAPGVSPGSLGTPSANTPANGSYGGNAPVALGGSASITSPGVPAPIINFGKPGPVGKIIYSVYLQGVTDWNNENVKAGRKGIPMAKGLIELGALSAAYLVEKYGLKYLGDDLLAAVNAGTPVAWCWWNGDRETAEEREEKEKLSKEKEPSKERTDTETRESETGVWA